MTFHVKQLQDPLTELTGSPEPPEAAAWIC